MISKEILSIMTKVDTNVKPSVILIFFSFIELLYSLQIFLHKRLHKHKRINYLQTVVIKTYVSLIRIIMFLKVHES